MRYTIKSVSELVGVAPQTIRYYESLGVLDYMRDSDSKYRYFSFADINVLMRSRMYKAFGMSLKESGEIIHAKSAPEAVEHFEAQLHVITRELAWQQYIVRHLQRYLGQLKSVEAQEGCFHYALRPPMLGLIYQDSHGLLSDQGIKQAVSDWMNFMPLPQPLFYFDYRPEKTWAERSHMGLCLTMEDADFLKLGPGPSLFYIDSCPAIYTVVKISIAPPHTYDYLPVFMERLKAEGLTLSGPVYGRCIISLDKRENHFAWGEFWLPFTQTK